MGIREEEEKNKETRKNKGREAMYENFYE